MLMSVMIAKHIVQLPRRLDPVRFPLPKPRESTSVKATLKTQALRIGAIYGTVPKVIELRPLLANYELSLRLRFLKEFNIAEFETLHNREGTSPLFNMGCSTAQRRLRARQ